MRRWSLRMFIFFRWRDHFQWNWSIDIWARSSISNVGVHSTLFQLLFCMDQGTYWLHKILKSFLPHPWRSWRPKLAYFAPVHWLLTPLDNCLFAVISIYLKGLITGSQLKLQEMIFRFIPAKPYPLFNIGNHVFSQSFGSHSLCPSLCPFDPLTWIKSLLLVQLITLSVADNDIIHFTASQKFFTSNYDLVN